MLSTLIPFIATLMITSTFCILSRRPFGRCIAMTLYFISVCLYLSQYLMRSFQPGFYVLIAAAALAVPLFFLFGGGASKNAGLIWTGGLWAYIGCLVVVGIMDAGRCLYSWDELMHWGKMVKEMFRLDRFYCVTESTLYRHKDYPPFVAILEYAWCRFGGKYSEPHVAQSVHLLNVSLIVPYLFEQFRARKKSLSTALTGILKGVLAAGILLILCSLCDPNTNISSIYEDITIALMFSYSAFLVYRKEYRSGWGIFAYALSLVALIGTKQIGIAFVGLSLLYLLLSVLFLSDGKEKRTGIICGLVSAIAAAAYYLSWDAKVASYASARQFDLGSNISIRAFLKVISDSKDRVHRDMLKRFIFALFEKNIASAPLAVTYFTSFLVVLLLLIALGYVFRDKISMIERVILGIVFTVGEGGYALMMLMLYELCFETQEMNSMHSFVRYMGSYFLAELALLLAVAVWLWGKKSPIWQKTRSMCIAFMLAAVLVVPAKLSFLLPQGILGDRVYDTRQYGAYITEHVQKGSNIYLLYHRTDGDREQISYSYFVDGSWIDHAYYDFSQENLAGLDVSALTDTLGKDDYLFSLEVTDGMNRALSAYNGGKKLKNYTLYEIQKKSGKIALTEVKK